MSCSELVEILKEAAEVGVWGGTGNLDEEALENIEYLPDLVDDAEDADSAELAAALADTVEAWLQDAASDGTGRPGVVYAWYDDQAGQLRMSFVSAGRDDIPFRVSLLFVDRAQDVVEEFLARGHRDPSGQLKIFALEVAGAV
ncbi:hypothetical protein [Kitasatospora purpeofusca]|uniref:hypothetical protein n=1 Tax=Kitasatospora purpeofusca TaxID=67352 RepID=UPI002A5A45EF|nr:hypothetical protein [Kitasatospora purpeofusca]MDY0812433.1 hypothetical protein [Kitasatospora purpeofusca]